MYSCSQKNAFFTLHENGQISLWVKEKNSNLSIFSSQYEPIGNDFEKIDSNLNYQLCAHTDQMRLSKNTKVYGFSVCPTTQKNIVALLNDGRVLRFKTIKKVSSQVKNDFEISTSVIFYIFKRDMFQIRLY